MDLHVINLDRTPERWDKIQQSFQAFPEYKLRRFSAVDGKTFTEAQIKELVSSRAFYILHRKFRLCHEDFTTLGAIGCYLSHIALWKECVRQNKPFFILEDDFKMERSMGSIFHEAQTLIPQLGFMLLQNINLRGNTTRPYNSTWNSFQGLFFELMVYCISPSMAQQLLQDAMPIDCQLDSYIGQMSIRNDFQIYCSHHPKTFIDYSSSIQNANDCPLCDMGVGYGQSRTVNEFIAYLPYVELGIILILLGVCIFNIFKK